MKIDTVIPLGDVVLCDLCGEDWTTRPEPGGLLFGTKGVCPDCAPRLEADVTRYGEECFIRARPNEGESFASFVRRIRGPDAKIKITSYPTLADLRSAAQSDSE